MKTGQIFSHVRWINKKFQCRHNAKKNWARLTTLSSEIENATLQKWNIIVLSIYTQQDCCFLYTCFKIREINDCEKRWHAQALVYTLIVFAILSVRKMVTYYWLQTFDLVANSNLFIWVGAGGLATNYALQHLLIFASGFIKFSFDLFTICLQCLHCHCFRLFKT